VAEQFLAMPGTWSCPRPRSFLSDPGAKVHGSVTLEWVERSGCFPPPPGSRIGQDGVVQEDKHVAEITHLMSRATVTSTPGTGIKDVPGTHHARFIGALDREHAVVEDLPTGFRSLY